MTKTEKAIESTTEALRREVRDMAAYERVSGIVSSIGRGLFCVVAGPPLAVFCAFGVWIGVTALWFFWSEVLKLVM